MIRATESADDTHSNLKFVIMLLRQAKKAIVSATFIPSVDAEQDVALPFKKAVNAGSDCICCSSTRSKKTLNYIRAPSSLEAI